MSTNDGSTFYATERFKEGLLGLINSPNSSFSQVAQMLVFHPPVVAVLLQKANKKSGNSHSHNRILEKPKNVVSVINFLGVFEAMKSLNLVETTPLEQERFERDQAIHSYALGSLMAYLAETMLGRSSAPDFFLVGLMASILEENPVILNDCHEEVQQFFGNVCKSDGPSISGARALIKSFSEGKGVGSDAYKVWDTALDRAKKMFE